MHFPDGYLQGELDRRSLSQEDFAKIAGVSRNTVYRACKGEALKKRSYDKIRVSLSVVPVLGALEAI